MYEENAAFYSFFGAPITSLSPKTSFVLNYLKGDRNSRVLDVGSGPGDMAFELAKAGAFVTCVEPSAAMRAVFLSRLIDHRDLDDRLTLLAGSAATFTLDARYKVVCALSLLFLLKNRAEQLEALRRLGKHVTEGGVLIANLLMEDVNARESPRELKGERTLGEVIYRHFSAKRFLDGRQTVEWTFETWHLGKLVETTTELFPLLSNSYGDYLTLVNDAGLDISSEFSGFGGSAFEAGRSKSLVAVLTPS